VRNCCKNCAFFDSRNKEWGDCLNPKNATKSSSGGEYPTDLIKPSDTRAYLVCDHWEAGKPANKRLAFEPKLGGKEPLYGRDRNPKGPATYTRTSSAQHGKLSRAESERFGRMLNGLL
jgi:hypothetical protein